MSDELYPISLIDRLTIERHDRVLADEFEDGSTAARNLWPQYYFKRRLGVQHSPLTEAEFRYLRAFNAARSGRYDSFWFRDNVHRTGNVKVRFGGVMPMQLEGRTRRVAVTLDEIAAIRALPEFTELTTAAGTAASCWFDANREIYYLHAGATINGEASAYDSMLAYPAAWQAGTLPLGGSASQYQHFAFTGSEWAKTGTVSAVTGTQPAVTLFCIAKHGTIASKQVLASLGTMGTGKAFGLAVAADNRYEPWIGGSETWTNARTNNSAIDTWRSFAVTAAASSNDVKLYTNAALVGTDTNTRSFASGPVALGATVDGTLKCSGNVAHVMVFAAALTLAQIKAVHNLLGYQFGLATVA